MSLRAACHAHLGAGLPVIVSDAAAATEILALRLAATSGRAPVELPPVESLDRVARRIDEALATGAALSRRDLRQAPWCLWASATPLAAREGHVDRLLERIAAAGRPRLLTALATAYVQGFALDRSAIATIGAFLAERAEGLGDPWASAQRDLAVFSPAEGPGRMAAAARARGVTPGDVLAEAGLGEATGLTLAAMAAGYAALAGESNHDPAGRLRVVELWAFDGEAVRFEALRAAAVAALVVPFGRSAPRGALREAVLAVVMRLLGDPRVETSRWTGASAAEAIVRRWLDGAAVVRFLETAEHGGEEDPWLYRRAFWAALFETGTVDRTQIVHAGSADTVGAVAARGLFGDGVALARFEGPTVVPPGHSVLLLEVGTLTIADWSHGSPCFIWDRERGEKPPELGREAYTAEELRKAHVGDNSEANMAKQGKFFHRASTFYKWQGAVADYLRGRRGIILSRADYQVRE